MKNILLLVFLGVMSLQTFAVNESTQFGKIVGIESRSWGMHIQTDFVGGTANGCAVNVGDTYMFDFIYDNTRNGTDASDEVSMILAAFAAQSDIAFHIYECNSAGNRPVIGYIRLRK